MYSTAARFRRDHDGTTNSNSFRGAKVVRDGVDPKKHGAIRGVPVGKMFKDRLECSRAGIHAPLRAGIHGNGTDGAFSVVLSGGYEDDEDHGETITYTGEGGRDAELSKLDKMRGKTSWSGVQNADQEWTRGNKALKISSGTMKPIRVVRGHTLNSRYAPGRGYRYDGLYLVVKAWRAVGKSGFKTCRFTFERLPGQPPLPGAPPSANDKAKLSMLSAAASSSNPPATSSVRPRLPYITPRKIITSRPEHRPLPSATTSRQGIRQEAAQATHPKNTSEGAEHAKTPLAQSRTLPSSSLPSAAPTSGQSGPSSANVVAAPNHVRNNLKRSRSGSTPSNGEASAPVLVDDVESIEDDTDVIEIPDSDEEGADFGISTANRTTWEDIIGVSDDDEDDENGDQPLLKKSRADL